MTKSDSPAEPDPRSWFLKILRRVEKAHKAAFILAAYAIPAFLLSDFLQSLTGGALWVPGEWRGIILILGFMGGLATFNWARASLDKDFPPTPPKKEGQRESKQAQADRDARDQKIRRTISAQRRALLWFAVTVLAIGAHTVFRRTYVVQWEPKESWVKTVFSEELDALPEKGVAHADDGSKSEWDPTIERWSGPAFVSYENGVYRASLLFPIGFPRSERAKNLVSNLRAVHKDAAHLGDQALLVEKSAADTIDTIDKDESFWFAVTQFAMVFLHLLVFCLASYSYGFGFTWVEEVTHYFWGIFAT